MADLAFTVDYKQLKAANAELERTGKVSKNSAQAFEAAFSQVVKWQQKFSTEQSKVSAKLEETYRNQNLANKSARDSARAFEEAERATKRLAQTKEELSRKYKPLYAQSKLYERSLEEINQANKLGVLTDKQRQASIQELNQAFTTGTGVFSKYASEASRRTNQMGVVTQQVGYQVGDFLVQVQSGTNVMVAFGQQATQLVGVLPLMGAGFMGLSQVALVGLSAGLGIAIPLVTAIGAAFLRTRESTNSAKDAISELDSALKSLDGTLKDWVLSKKAAAAGVTVEELLGTTSLEQAETNLANAKSKLKLAKALERSTGGVGVVGAAATAYNFFAGGSVEQLEEEVKKAEERIKTLKKKNLAEEKADRDENVADMIQVFRDAQKRMREEDEETRRLRVENQLSMIETFRDAQKRFREEEMAKTKESLDRLFANRTLLYSIRFSGDADVMSQSLTPSNKPLKPTQSYQDLIKMGWTPEDLERIGVKPPRKSGGGGSKTDPVKSQFEQLEKFLATERELVVTEYENRQLTLEQSLEKGYLAKETYAEMELELERRKQAELGAIEEQTQKAKVSAIAGGIADVLSAAANGNEKMLKMARVVGAAEALINTYRAAAQTLADPSLPFYAKFSAVAATVAAGLSMVSSIKSGSSSASGSAATMPAQAAAPTPQRVIIEGIDRNSLFSGEQLSNIFEAIYEENENRGMVFEVAR